MSTRRTDFSSRRSTRKTPVGSLTPSYDIYCINFYDNGLNAVRDEFIKQIKVGLRRFLFVIDLENEIEEAKYYNELQNRLSKAVKKADEIPLDPVGLSLLRIQDCLEEYDFVSRKIEAEISFNLLKYWQKHVPADLKIRAVNTKKDKAGMDSSRARTGSKTSKSKSKETTDSVRLGKITCFAVTAKEHNTVGKGQPLSKRLYIKDQPLNTTIVILIIGSLENDFYKSLLAHKQPVRGIIHFLPEECAYDLLVPRPRREKYLRETIEKIQQDIHSLCKRTATKPVGIFQQQLPQMSMCLASKFSSDIFDQLSWFTYDVQMLRDQYHEYYVKPYHEINIKMSPGVSMKDSLQMAESLSIQGHYLNAEMPAVHDDDGTVYLYLESLMCTFGNPRELMTEMEVLLLANPSSVIQTKVLDKIKVYANAFKSIIKLLKSERLFVEEANPLLTSIVSYMDQKLMRNIYHACLEYNILRRYFHSGYITESLYYTPYIGDEEPRHLPKYAKLYLTDDAVTQRIVQLINEYDNYKIEEVFPNVKLYTFRRGLNEVFENQKQIVIPTRLCFRDFTLYEMQQFLKDLITPKMFEDAIDTKPDPLSEYPSVYTLPGSRDEPNPYNCRSNKRYSITPSVFIRPKSLKANKVAEQQKEKEKVERFSSRVSRQRNESSRINDKSGRGQTLAGPGIPKEDSTPLFKPDVETDSHQPTFIGLGPDHPMLTGYNLDDTRQTIKIKTSKYYFEEGLMSLYEEKWNFRQMNKCLSIEIDKQIIHFTNELGKIGVTSPNIRVQTPNGISLRINPNTEECAKAVLNYPNGLSLYCHDTHAEHIWNTKHCELNESRRVCTPYGCVIVFYNNNDTVLIMRYNGEVYRLYSYVEPMVEEEGEFEESSEFINACSTQSTYSSYKPLQSVDSNLTKRKKKNGRKGRSQTNRTTGGTDSLPRKTSQGSGSTSSLTLAAKAAKIEARTMQLSQTAALFNSIDGELSYLNFIMQLFNLSYKHLKLTTSLGSVVHVEKKDKIYCGKPIRVTEWHDYYANESYAMRDDGVRTVWSEDELRCYHSDGTVITTTTVNGVDPGVIEDDIDKQISSSSSHIADLGRNASGSLQSNMIYVNIPQGELLSDYVSKITTNVKSKNYGIDEFLQEGGEVEDQYIYDYSFVTYTPNSYHMQHKYYACTQFFFTHINAVDLKLETKVLAADNLQFHIYPCTNEVPIDELVPNSDGTEDKFPSSSHQEPLSSEADPDEWTKNKSGVKSPQMSTESKIIPIAGVEIEASNLHIWLHEDNIELNAQLRKFGCDENALVVRENIKLKTNLTQSLSTAFHNWVQEFHSFINCFCPKWRNTYFVESISEECRRKGFELFKDIPGLGDFNFCAGNYFIDPEELKSINARMTTKFAWYDKDMAKFPRFPLNRKIKAIVNFPSVLSTKVFVEIPAQLAYTDRIHLFVYPFDKIKFRKLKYRFNEALLFHLHPSLRLLVHQEISKRSWRNHHIENGRRLFMEQQRLSLYVAMLKHKVYPNYFQFKDQFYSHVRNIDFFEFMASKCNEKANPDHYKEPKPEEESLKPPTKQEAGIDGQKSHRKKCLCPKYLNSFK